MQRIKSLDTVSQEDVAALHTMLICHTDELVERKAELAKRKAELANCKAELTNCRAELVVRRGELEHLTDTVRAGLWGGCGAAVGRLCVLVSTCQHLSAPAPCSRLPQLAAVKSALGKTVLGSK